MHFDLGLKPCTQKSKWKTICILILKDTFPHGSLSRHSYELERFISRVWSVQKCQITLLIDIVLHFYFGVAQKRLFSQTILERGLLVKTFK